MFQIYCENAHEAHLDDCSQCRELLAYAEHRLERCPFGEEKSTCASCTVHCYKPDMRERIKEVMRYGGPRMTLRHPILAIYHLLDSRRPSPRLAKRPAPDRSSPRPTT